MSQGPIIRQDGSLCWYDELGNYHRDDGPAIITPENGEVYYHHGSLHRLDGPAIIIWHASLGLRVERYFIHGKEYDIMEFHFWSKCHEIEN